jgi:hypothetical protein
MIADSFNSRTLANMAVAPRIQRYARSLGGRSLVGMARTHCPIWKTIDV